MYSCFISSFDFVVKLFVRRIIKMETKKDKVLFSEKVRYLSNFQCGYVFGLENTKWDLNLDSLNVRDAKKGKTLSETYY